MPANVKYRTTLTSANLFLSGIIRARNTYRPRKRGGRQLTRVYLKLEWLRALTLQMGYDLIGPNWPRGTLS